MQVILNQPIQGQGVAGSIITVKRGYARNFLFPQGLAVMVNASNMAALEEKRAQYVLQDQEAALKAQQLATSCAGVSVRIVAAVKGDHDLYGSISKSDIAEALKKQGIEIPRQAISIAEGSIKALGSYTAVCQLHETVAVQIAVHVVAEDSDV